MAGIVMYLDYESFIDCLVKSGYKKTDSCLTKEFWVGYTVWVELIHQDYERVVKVESGNIIRVEKV